MTESFQYTLWLWTEGAFARRVMYQLLIKGLVASPSHLLRGETTSPSLRVVPVELKLGMGWAYPDGSERPPEAASNPCMKVTNHDTGTFAFIYESTSIILLLETIFSRHPMQPPQGIARARMMDMLGKINLIAIDTNYFLRNTVPEHGATMGVDRGHQSRFVALNARSCELKGLLKIQEWAKENGLTETHGWLTPGIDGPGLVDVTLVSNHRFVELNYGIDMLEDDRLNTLAGWYDRFQCLQWWGDFEEREGVVPEVLASGGESRAAWVRLESLKI
ncbi:hypothetical protein FALBO_2293 [Fusarium albosuccineum]|uniref:GST N-terminal domain-containing protein n=1 Tax=Fusarium albosuccineum TaxID=1237068 RepID=A0A8H4LK00_9HYPO|nr:hypothetical protein FALBO_2293 [Fusarium albosuccineum]